MKHLIATSAGECIKFIVDGIVKYEDVAVVYEQAYFIDNVFDFVKHVKKVAASEKINPALLAFYAAKLWLDGKIVKMTEPHPGFVGGNWTDETGRRFTPTAA